MARIGALNMGDYINCKHCSNVFFADEEWKRICLRCWIKQKKRAEESKYQNSYRPPPPPKHNVSNELKEMLPLLIRLCHPDRHSNSETSNKATQWLLKQRNNP